MHNIATPRPTHRVLDPATRAPVAIGKCALGIMTKAPVPGKVKTRLTPPLTPDEAAALNVCFLQDLARSIADAGALAQGVGVYTPVGSEAAYAEIFPEDFVLIPQRGDGFGERLEYAISDLLAVGFESACLINSDSPTVSSRAFADATEALHKDGDRVVLGPSDDGGYYLIGMKQLHRGLFEGIEWSTEKVLAQTLARAKELGLEVHMLPAFYDIDDGAILRRLCGELLADEIQAADSPAPATRRFLTQLIEREGRGRIWPE